MKIYADNAATTKMSKTAVNVMHPYFDEVYGNPSSLHTSGQKAAEALHNARERISIILNCQPREITFTSGGSEADNQVIVSVAKIGESNGKKHIISTSLNGDRGKRLLSNVHFCFEGIEGESLLLLLDAKGICTSSGSACTSDSLDPSHVLLFWQDKISGRKNFILK